MHDKIKELHNQGNNLRAIAKILGVNPSTVAKYLKMDAEKVSRNTLKKINRPSAFDKAKEFIEERLSSNPGIKKRELYRKVLERYPDINVGERSFLRYLKRMETESELTWETQFNSKNTTTNSNFEYKQERGFQQRYPIEGIEAIIGEKVKQYRKRIGISKKELAAKINVTPPLITYYEQGTRQPPIKTLLRIAEITRVPIEYFLNDEEYPFSVVMEESNDDRESIRQQTEKVGKNDHADEKNKIEDLIQKAYQLKNSDPHQCIVLSKEAMKIACDIHYNKGIGDAYVHIGLGFFHQSDYRQALKNYLSAEPIFKKEANYEGIRVVYNNIGLVYSQWNDYERALEYYHKNLKLEDKYSDPELTASILNNTASVYNKLEQRSKAFQYYKKALEISETNNIEFFRMAVLNNIGKYYYNISDYSKSEDNFCKAIKLAQEANNLTVLTHVYMNLSDLKTVTGQYQEAMRLLDKSLVYAQKMKDYNKLSYGYFKYANLKAKMGDIPGQERYLKKCIFLAEPNDYRSVCLSAYTMLVALYEESKDYRLALQCHKKINQLKDFLGDEKRTRAIEELRTKMEVERTEREKSLLQQKNAELRQKNYKIMYQKKELEKAEKELIELNRNLEVRVREEVKKRREQEHIIIQKSKLESLGRMAAGIAHEINQPLGLIQIAAQNLFQKFESNSLAPDYLSKKSQFIFDNITRINKIIEHVRIFSREHKEDKEIFNVSETLNDSLSLINTQFTNHNIRIIKQIEAQRSETMGNRYRLEQVFLNVLSNAKDALDAKFDQYDDRKKIVLRIFSQRDTIKIEVEDNGCGLDKEEVKNVFEPFFTTKEKNKGTGLGLSISHGIINDMGGKISMESKKGDYTVVKIDLPAFPGRKTT